MGEPPTFNDGILISWGPMETMGIIRGLLLLMDEIRRSPVEVGSLCHDLYTGFLAPSQVVIAGYLNHQQFGTSHGLFFPPGRCGQFGHPWFEGKCCTEMCCQLGLFLKTPKGITYQLTQNNWDHCINRNM